MKLARKQSESSFYESFSDLVFGALVLMIVIVAALAAKTKKTTANVESEMKKLVYSNRFAGGGGRTTLYLGYIDISGRNHVVFFPADIGDRWTLNRNEQHRDPSLVNDPVLALCEIAKQPDGIEAMVLPVDEFLKCGGGLNYACVENTSVFQDFGMAITRLLQIKRGEPQEYARASPSELKRRIGGLYLDDPIRADLQRISDLYELWVGFDMRPMFEGDVLLATRLKAAARDNEPAIVRFTVTPERRLTVGHASLAPAQFRALLRAFRPGRGSYLEFLSADGKATEPPAWVIEEVLRPVGYDGRILNEAGLKSVRGG